MDAPGGYVLTFAWLLALPFALGLLASRRSVLPALAIGPVLAAAVIIEEMRIGDTMTRADVVAISTASTLGAVCVTALVAHIRWVRRVFRDAERELVRRETANKA